MRKVKEALRLKFSCGLSVSGIARSLCVARSTVSEYLSRADSAGISWPLPDDIDDDALERLVFPVFSSDPSLTRPRPDFSEVHKELKRKGVTLLLLWQEYKAVHPSGYQYTQFCNLYREWKGHLDLPMRFNHKAGEKLFVDYCGPTLPVVNRTTGEVREAQIFVGVLGASSYTFTEATWTQTLPDWTGSHVRAFSYFGGVTEIVVPDNLASGVSKACRYEPDINPTYQDLAAHYGLAVIPARVRKPRDKAKAEAGVLLVERWILAKLRHRTFFSLDDLNAAIGELREALNDRPFQKQPGSRRSLFEKLDKPALGPLPSSPYQYGDWKKAKLNIDYHVAVLDHYYSVPYRLVRQTLDIRFTSTTVEIYHKGKRVASHLRSRCKGAHTTIKAHMPKSHQRHLQWTPVRIISWAEKTGTATADLVAAIMARRPHPEQGFRSCLGIMRLSKVYGDERLEAACQRALFIKAFSYKSIRSILKTRLDQQALPEKPKQQGPIDHPNVRGSHYYH